MLFGVGTALLLPARLTREMVSGSGWVGSAIPASAAILVITGADGAFGKVLQVSDIAAVIQAVGILFEGGVAALVVWVISRFAG